MTGLILALALSMPVVGEKTYPKDHPAVVRPKQGLKKRPATLK